MPIGEIGLAPETRSSDRSGSSEACASTSAPHTCHGNFHELRECRAASPETRGNETVDGFPMPMPMSCAGRGGRPGSPGSDQPGRRPALSVLLHHNGSRKNSPPHCCYFGYEARAVYVGACDDEISAQRAEGLGLAAAACAAVGGGYAGARPSGAPARLDDEAMTSALLPVRSTAPLWFPSISSLVRESLNHSCLLHEAWLSMPQGSGFCCCWEQVDRWQV